MKYKESKVLLLKPAGKFISFIQFNFPNLNWNGLDAQFDQTAYILPESSDDDGLILEMEKFYSEIFQNELEKIIGNKLAKKVKTTFFDFLSCFKFEIHEDITIFGKNGFLKPKLVKVNFSKNISSLSLSDICASLSHQYLSNNIKVNIQYYLSSEQGRL
ncbi:MAG: hypothetical protein A3E88_02625 [Legionellales bacterium RIFCSPHIGHO2_12_FULL_35_11]|nr:MAG: hypothetical protein A3E88_02625 [Legionellales bacterium RIFCSPHIGHO2_12_FULL_35_11]